MPSAESLLRTILGPVRSSIRPLVFAVEITDALLFLQHFSVDDILVTKHVYPDVAKMIHKSPDTTSRAIERLSLRCWDSLIEQNLVSCYLGCNPKQKPTPASLIIYLAVYAHLEVPFSTAVNLYPDLLFPSPASITSAIPLDDQDLLLTALRLYLPMPVTHRLLLPTSTGPSSFPICPSCNRSMDRDFQCYCGSCGQHLDWTHYKNAEVVFPDHLIPLH